MNVNRTHVTQVNSVSTQWVDLNVMQLARLASDLTPEQTIVRILMSAVLEWLHVFMVPPVSTHSDLTSVPVVRVMKKLMEFVKILTSVLLMVVLTDFSVVLTQNVKIILDPTDVCVNQDLNTLASPVLTLTNVSRFPTFAVTSVSTCGDHTGVTADTATNCHQTAEHARMRTSVRMLTSAWDSVTMNQVDTDAPVHLVTNCQSMVGHVKMWTNVQNLIHVRDLTLNVTIPEVVTNV